jgi:hypothetical protein
MPLSRLSIHRWEILLPSQGINSAEGIFPGNSGIQISSFAFAALVFISLIENLSVFLTGAVYFKKNKVLFTILILTGLQTIFSWIIMILGMSADDLPMWLESFNPTAQDFVNFLNWEPTSAWS